MPTEVIDTLVAMGYRMLHENDDNILMRDQEGQYIKVYEDGRIKKF